MELESAAPRSVDVLVSHLPMSNLSCGTITCDELRHDLIAVYETKLVNLSAFAILIYDYVLTLGREKDLVWCKGPRIGWGTGLFLAIRYLTLFVVTFIIIIMFLPQVSVTVGLSRANTCIASTAWVKLHWFAGVLIVMLAEITLQIRIYAMYGNTKTIFYFLIFTFIATFGTILSFIIRLIAREDATFFKPTDNTLFICVPLHLPGYFKEVWVPLFVHELILCVLAVNKGVQSVRSYGKEGFRSRFTTFLVADSVIYYFAVLAVFFSLELVWVIKGIAYIELPFGHAVVIGSIMCQRLLLKIRGRYYAHNGEHSTLRQTAMLEFQSLGEEYSMSTFRAA